MKAVNKLLAKADKALTGSGIVENGKIIKSVFKGYVSSFGAMVIQNGLPAAVAINMRTEGEGKERVKVIKAIAAVLERENVDELLKECCDAESHLSKSRLLKEEVMNASVGLKLMMRTYEFYEPEN